MGFLTSGLSSVSTEGPHGVRLRAYRQIYTLHSHKHSAAVEFRFGVSAACPILRVGGS